MGRHTLAPELANLCERLSRAAGDRKTKSKNWLRAAAGMTNGDDRLVALDRAAAYDQDYTGTQAMRTGLIEGTKTAFEAVAWLDALEANR